MDWGMVGDPILIPDVPGIWKHVDTGDILDVYDLGPANDTLCIWGPDVGIRYTGATDVQGCWCSDDLQGHIPIYWYILVNYTGYENGWELVK